MSFCVILENSVFLQVGCVTEPKTVSMAPMNWIVVVRNIIWFRWQIPNKQTNQFSVATQNCTFNWKINNIVAFYWNNSSGFNKWKPHCKENTIKNKYRKCRERGRVELKARAVKYFSELDSIFYFCFFNNRQCHR